VNVTRPAASSGMALLCCTAILTVVVLLTMTMQRLMRESLAMAWNTADRELALQSAEAALMDAEQAIRQMAETNPDDGIDKPPVHNPLFQSPSYQSPFVQGKMLVYGSLTGNQMPHGGKRQTLHLPVYFVTLHPLQEPTAAVADMHSYRVTALGVGLHASTRVVLQADFIYQQCAAVVQSPCVAGALKRVAWHELPALPAELVLIDAQF